MIPFLKSVAEGYADRFFHNDLHQSMEYCFVFPNKRAGTFFLNYLRDELKQDVIAPHVLTISDFVNNLSGRLVDSRIDLLFLLYRTYLALLDAESIPPETDGVTHAAVSFDAFRKWGDTVLMDFNEVDMQNVDPDAIFKNIADFRKIASTFLTDEQRAVMEEYFGYAPPSSYDDSKFWQSFEDELANFSNRESEPDGSTKEGASSVIRSRFIYLWKILSPLYHAFNQALAERGLTTSGGAYRLALENLEMAYDADDSATKITTLLPYKKIVMVGFNALSMSERAIFSLLQRLPSPDTEEEHLVDFVWDATGPVLSDIANSAGRFVAINRRDYPSPEWLRPFLRKSDTKTLPEVIESIAAPSKVMQIKVATNLINDLRHKKGKGIFDEAKVALVVPDESLLLPLLYSLPKDIEEVNLTMGYPLSLTAVSSFLALLRMLQLAPRNSSAYRGYAYEKVKDVLAHPYAHAIFSTTRIRKFCKDKERRHVNVVRDYEFEELGEYGAIVFRQLDLNTAPHDVIVYLDNILQIVGDSLDDANINMDEGNALLKGKLEHEHVRAWREALQRFDEAIADYDIRMNVATTLGEAYRLLRGEIVAFEGEPLRGLQIMGLLETRSLDFDYLYIVGMNDRVLPGRGNRRSFIPNVIRRGFGMPPNTYTEELFGYYFYRLMSRASFAHLIFDNRVTGLSGGESRYLLQLRHIYARDRISDIEYKFRLSSSPLQEFEFAKTPEVLEKLERYCRDPYEGERRYNLSPSLLKKYTSCPIKFYYMGVLDLKDDPTPTGAVDNITFGNIVHHVLEQIYLKGEKHRHKWLEPPVAISPEYLSSLIEDKDNLLLAIIRRAINKEHYRMNDDALDTPLQADTEIVAEGVLDNVLDVLKYDLKKAPFSIYGLEMSADYDYCLPDGRRVNMKYIIDRIDDIDCQGESGKVRIIDYKTGNSYITAEKIEDMLSDNYKSDHLTQLAIYSLLMNLHREEDGLSPLRYGTVIYPVGKLTPSKYNTTRKGRMIPNVGGAYLEEINDILPEFTPLLEDKIAEIFDPDIPFKASPSKKKCANCIFFDACSSA